MKRLWNRLTELREREREREREEGEGGEEGASVVSLGTLVLSLCLSLSVSHHLCPVVYAVIAWLVRE